jgi:transcriptional regulator with XRE-family HTH domain
MDWPKLIDEIKSKGYTQERIANVCGCSIGNLSELRSGKVRNPTYPLGKALVEMHKKVSAVKRKQTLEN